VLLVVPPVLMLAMSVLVQPQLDLGNYEECQDHRSQLVGPEIHPKLLVLSHPLMVSSAITGSTPGKC
jgi:hypothetical protein